MLYKRSGKSGAHWWVRFSIKGVEVRQSSGTDRKELAEAFEQQLREAIWNEQNLGIEVHTWEEATERWFREKSHKRSLERDRQAVRAIDISGGLADLDFHAAANTVGARERAVLRSILNACVKWNWIDRAPKVEMPHAEKHDPRWITKQQFEKLKTELPAHAQSIAAFGVHTGLRSGNIRNLRWSACDLGKGLCYVASGDAKGGRAIGIPLSGPAQRILRRQVGLHPDYAFVDHLGRAPVGSLKTCWAKATKRAGIPGFRFHDLRHSWAAWHTLKGTPPVILKELGGWSSLAMVERYSHLNPGHLADWADNSPRKVRTKSGTRKKHGKRKSL